MAVMYDVMAPAVVGKKLKPLAWQNSANRRSSRS
jgi:hypothetical protein